VPGPRAVAPARLAHPRYAEMVYNGFWFAPEREALQAFIDKSQERVTGTVRLKLYKGGVYPVGRKSPYSLYNPELATFEEDRCTTRPTPPASSSCRASPAGRVSPF
jgi:argininosuccinate synthase